MDFEGEQYSNDFSDTVCGEPYDETYTYLVCDDSNGSSSNTGGYSPPTFSNGREKYFGFIPQIVTANIDYFIKWLEDKDCISRKILTYVDDYQITNFSPANIALNPAKVDSAKATAIYDTKDNTIYFREPEDVGRCTTLYEELIHSIQRAVYTENDRNIASLNMEFEAKLIIDYILLSMNGSGDTELHLFAEITTPDVPVSIFTFLSNNKNNEFSIEAFFRYALEWKETTANEIYKEKNFSSLVRPVLIENLVNSIRNSNCYNP